MILFQNYVATLKLLESVKNLEYLNINKNQLTKKCGNFCLGACEVAQSLQAGLAWILQLGVTWADCNRAWVWPKYEKEKGKEDGQDGDLKQWFAN